MKQNIVELLKFINKQGYDNSQWGLIDFEVDTKTYFGTLFNHSIKNFFYVYWNKEDVPEGNFLSNIDPDYFLSFSDNINEYIFIFKY